MLCKHEVVGSIPSGSTIGLVSSLETGLSFCLRLSREIRPELRFAGLIVPMGFDLLFVIVNRFF